MNQAESVKKLLEMDMGSFHSVVDCVAGKMTAQHSSLLSKEVEKRLREKVRWQEVVKQAGAELCQAYSPADLEA